MNKNEKMFNYLVINQGDKQFKDFDNLIESTNILRALGATKKDFVVMEETKALLLESKFSRKEIEANLELYNHLNKQKVKLAEDLNKLLKNRKNKTWRVNKNGI